MSDSDLPQAQDPSADLHRVSKLMAQRGLCSRRVAERLIAAGFVTVNGHSQREQGWKAPEHAEISIDPRGQAWLDEAVTVVLHKPEGVVSTQPEGAQVPAWKLLIRANGVGQIPPEVMERVTAQPWYFAVTGRLDKDSRGLLIMTQDGVLAKHLTATHRFTKIYEVTFAEAVKSSQIEQLRQIRQLDGKPLKAMKVTRMGNKALRFELVEGRKHQIRRSCEQVGLQVTDLLRTQVGPVRLGKLAPSEWRLASPDELAVLSQPAAATAHNSRPQRPGQAKSGVKAGVRSATRNKVGKNHNGTGRRAHRPRR